MNNQEDSYGGEDEGVAGETSPGSGLQGDPGSEEGGVRGDLPGDGNQPAESSPSDPPPGYQATRDQAVRDKD
jgi:hypothetical protein